jgi:tetratricopeptide (TPR) repeat protein
MIVTTDNADVRRIGDLLKESTARKDEADYAGAEACLREAYRLMEDVGVEWPITTFLRLPRVLHLAGRYDEAIKEFDCLLADLEPRFARRDHKFGRKTSKKLINIARRAIQDDLELTQVRERKRQAKANVRRKS